VPKPERPNQINMAYAYNNQQQQSQWQSPPYQQGGYTSFGGPGPSAPAPPPAGFNFSQEPKPSPPFGRGGPDSEFDAFEFSDKTIRLGFIRKVYSILMVQLLVTVGFISLFVYNESAALYARQNPGLFVAALVLTLITIIAMACCESVRRKTPTNFIFLGLFTICEGFLLGVASSTYQADEVLLAAGITTFICLGLTLFSFQTKYDFTTSGGILFCLLMVLVLFSFLLLFMGTSKIVTIVYSCLGALLFSAYLVYDTQLMIGGKHQYSISPEEYIFAALNLYLDVINIFLYVLRIIGAARD